MRLPSGDTVSPWGPSIPLISPTTLLVVASMMWRLSPAEFDCTIRSFCCAVAGETNAAHMTTLARSARYLLVIFKPLCSTGRDPPAGTRGESVHQEKNFSGA